MALCRHLLYLFLFIILTASERLTGPNVCRDSVSVNLSRVISETYIENANCPGQQQAPCILTRNKTEYYIEKKTVWFCCPGWSQTGNKCSQPCPANTYGRGCNQTCNCTNANTFCNPALGCLCNAGYKTPNCTVPCDEGSYGYSCTQECTCLNGATCDPVNGSCSCTPGWMGVDCNTTCPAAIRNVLKYSRLVIIVSSLAVMAIGVIMCVISKRCKRFIDTVSRLRANFGEPQKRAPKPKPKARTFERQSPAGRGEETTGDATTKNPVDPVYHVLNPDHSENE